MQKFGAVMDISGSVNKGFRIEESTQKCRDFGDVTVGRKTIVVLNLPKKNGKLLKIGQS